MEMEPDILESPDAIEIPAIKGNIEYKDVHFEYNPGEPVLKGVSVKVEPGMVVALVGSSGSGKSTFVKLLPRFYDVTGGTITIEGVDVRDAKTAAINPTGLKSGSRWVRVEDTSGHPESAIWRMASDAANLTE